MAKDVCLVESIGSVGGVEKFCEMPPTFIVHDNISNVESMHMQVAATHFFGTKTQHKFKLNFLGFFLLSITTYLWILKTCRWVKAW
jgi:hypothetical protein